MFLRIYIFSVFCLFCFIGKAQLDATGKIKAELQKAEKDPAFATAFIGFCLMDAQTGEVLVETNSQKSFITASAMKPVTIGAALALLGDTFRFKTIMEYAGPGHFLTPAIVFRGGGDPTFGSLRWDSTHTTIATVLSKTIKGINHIYFDNRFYGEEVPPPGYEYGDLGFYYGVPVKAFNYADNIQYLVADTTQVPDFTDPGILHDTVFYRLKGNVPLQNPAELNTKNYDANQAFAEYSPDVLFVNDLLAYDSLNVFDKEQPIVDGSVQHVMFRKPVHTFYSPPLLDIATKTNQESINLYAEGILRALSTKQYGYSTLDSSLAIAQRFWKETVGDTKGLRMTDGSGMSRSNLCTPLLFCKMFSAYSKRANFQSFYSTFAVAGQSGTVKNFGKGTKAEGNARIKTGTMSRVKTFVGYVKGANGRLYSFALMINNFEPDSKPTELARKIIPLIAEIK